MKQLDQVVGLGRKRRVCDRVSVTTMLFRAQGTVAAAQAWM
jgi:hypothetical protein